MSSLDDWTALNDRLAIKLEIMDVLLDIMVGLIEVSESPATCQKSGALPTLFDGSSRRFFNHG